MAQEVISEMDLCQILAFGGTQKGGAQVRDGGCQGNGGVPDSLGHAEVLYPKGLQCRSRT
jgi:hypothetical protein